MTVALARAALGVALVLGMATGARAQAGADVAGQVVDGVSGLGLSDVRVQIQGQSGSVLTDGRGQFTLRDIPPGTHVLTVSVVGFVMVRRDITVGEGGSIYLVIPLAEGTGTYSERVEVTGDLFREGEAGVPAQQVLGSADLQNLRGLVLDDPVRAMHVLPGVAATDDLYSEFSVRGSDFGRIGLAVEGVPSRFLSHSVQGVEDGGSVGMINSDVLESVSLQNGSYPQRFGNRTGAQIEMTLREGSRDRAQARVALSGSSASVVGEGPIGRGRKASWLLSARKSYLDLLIKQIADNETFAFGFTDLAAKVAVDLTARHQVQVSGLAGRAALDADQRDIGPNDPLVATNRGWLGALAWRYVPGPRVSWTQRVGVTGGEFSNRSLARVVLDEGRSTDVSVRSDAAFAVRPSLTVEAGGSVHWQDERVTKRRVVNPTRPPDIREDAVLDSRWVGGYALARWTLPRGGILGAGARVDHWDGTGETTASPWVNAQVRVGPLDLIGGTGLFHQFPGFNAITGLRGTPGLPAEHAWHADIGVGRRVGAHLRAQAVWFHRDERNGLRLPGDEWQLVDGRPRPPQADAVYDARLDGTSHGVELLVQRRSPNGLSGWASYSFGRYQQHDVVTGERFGGDFDQRHAVSLYGVYRLNDRTSVAMKLRASSNFPVRGYFQELPSSAEHPVPDDQPSRYGLSETRNGARLPVYQRLDLRANRTWTLQRSRLTLYVELMNVFGKTNWRTGNGG
ncbi:MAG: TonB-dependent receptor, partial [Vicinamibacteria bacterium]|nr:TonB-dependent receptor [Vicinamibacteria bacterium]